MSDNPYQYYFHTPTQRALLQAAVSKQDDLDYYELVLDTQSIYSSLQSDVEVYWISKNQAPPPRIHNVTAENVLRGQINNIPPVVPTAVGAVFSPGQLNDEQINQINSGTPWQTVVKETIRT